MSGISAVDPTHHHPPRSGQLKAMLMQPIQMTAHSRGKEFIALHFRGEYFYLVGGAHLQLIFFSSCRNIQFGVFRAEIFILWCIVQKYWSGIVTCYMKMRQINESHADLASFLFNCARKTLLFGVPAEILLIFVCAEILLSRVIAPPKSCAGPSLGVLQKY